MRKKKDGKKKDKKKKQVLLNETETLTFEQQILDYNRQLSRLKSRNEELEIEIENARQNLLQIKEDRADVVAHLKRSLEEKSEESHELNERLSALEALRKEELKAFKEKEEKILADYRIMENNLSAEVKLAVGKLNALEDWRLARNDLVQKFELQEKRMLEQEERHKQTLYEAEKSVILGKAKMQREMEEHLHKLAESFREATKMRIADATNRAIRENITLNNELDKMINVCRDLETKIFEQDEIDRILKLEVELREAEKQIILKKSTKQELTINKLADNNILLSNKYAKMRQLNVKLHGLKETLNNFGTKCLTAENQIRMLEQNLQQTRENQQQIVEEIQTGCKEFEKISKILQEAKNCIIEALQFKDEVCGEDVCSFCSVNLKEKMLWTLWNILEKQDIPDVIKRKMETENVLCRYQKGSLGLLQCPDILNEEQLRIINYEEVNRLSSQVENTDDEIDIYTNG